MTSRQTYVLDSFALLALFRNESAADAVAGLLRRADAGEVRLMMTAVNLAEVVYRTIRERGFERAQEVLAHIQAYTIHMVDVDRPLALAAANLKGLHRISFADCLAAALAQRESAAIVTGDRDFRQVEGLVTIEWLPRAKSQ